MGPMFMTIAGLALLGLVVVVYGLVNKRRSIVAAVISLGVALVAGLGALYARTESHSIPWTVTYGVVVLLGLIAAVRQFFKQPDVQEA